MAQCLVNNVCAEIKMVYGMAMFGVLVALGSMQRVTACFVNMSEMSALNC